MNNEGLKLSWGLFQYKWWHIGHNLKDFWIYLQRIRFVIKHGYPDFAHWETFYWFIKTMRPILVHYRHNREGTPWIIGENYNPDNKIDDTENEYAYNNLLDRMIVLLDSMDETDKIYENVDYEEECKMTADAANEFFRLFSEHFYEFWD